MYSTRKPGTQAFPLQDMKPLAGQLLLRAIHVNIVVLIFSREKCSENYTTEQKSKKNFIAVQITGSTSISSPFLGSLIVMSHAVFLWTE